MKRTIPLLALSASLGIVLSAQAAMASTTPTLSSKAIYFNGKLASKPDGFVENSTTYIPIWYVGQAFTQAGIKNTWQNNVFNFVTPSSMKLKITPTKSTSGAVKIAINGQIVETCNGITRNDPASGQPTTYVPIWYVIQALNQLQVTSGWDGTNWRMKATTPVSSKTSSTSTSKTSSGTSSIKTGSTTSGSNTSTSTSPKTTSSTSPAVKALVASIMSTTNYAQLPQLAWGSSGTYVSALQSLLTTLGYSVAVDGQFGDSTLQAVRSFEGSQNMVKDGVVTPTIWQEIQTAAKSKLPSSSQPQTQTQPATSFPTVDLRYSAPANVNASSIDNYLQSNNSPMTGLGQSFMDSQNTYGVDANYLVSHAILESYWGKSQIAQTKNNLFGYGAYDSAPGQDAGLFPSDEYAILFQGWEVRNNYLNPGASMYVSPTLQGMNVNYATDPQWASSIGSLMGQMASSLGDTVASYPKYVSTNQPPAPLSTQEPIFYTQATATIKTVPNYGGLPYYSSPGTGASEMYFGILQQGSFGASVAAIQSYLNQNFNAGLTVDGQFGPMTKQAVTSFQAAHGLPQTGQWSFSMWQMFNSAPPTIPSGQTVTVTQIAMGMANGVVVEWDYVPGYGWVYSQYLQLQNVYRAIATQPQSTNTSINVYGPDKQTVIQTIHSGYFVVANSTASQGGYIPVELCDQSTGQVMQGYISTSEANLVQVQ